jgi:prolyl-tRNA synthetase
MTDTTSKDLITASKTDEFSEWYRQVVFKTGLLEYYDISGCYVILPEAYAIWEFLQKYLDENFKRHGVKNVYFPMLISQSNLTKETSHIEGFQPEVAWVTKAGNSQLNSQLAIRPTSECAFYPTMAKIIKSHSDLPLKWNQWCSVLRWEFSDPTPFIRSREFLWNEGHCAFSTNEEANENVLNMINLYKRTYSDVLAVPVIRGKKTELEKFAGASSTLTVESFIKEAGKAIQCATAHNLGQNFSKIFEVNFQNTEGNIDKVWQTSWGFTTRSIGVAIMTHSDNKGLILPPRVADIQVVIVPIIFKKMTDDTQQYINSILENLQSNNVRAHFDDTNHRPGWKYNYWETRGIPIRLEIGPSEVTNKTIVMYKRITGTKTKINSNNIGANISNELSIIHEEMYNAAKNRLVSSIKSVSNISDFADAISNKFVCCIPYCQNTKCEETLKKDHSVKSLCVPNDGEYDGQFINETNLCLVCKEECKGTYLLGKGF